MWPAKSIFVAHISLLFRFHLNCSCCIHNTCKLGLFAYVYYVMLCMLCLCVGLTGHTRKQIRNGAYPGLVDLLSRPVVSAGGTPLLN